MSVTTDVLTYWISWQWMVLWYLPSHQSVSHWQ